MVSYIGSVGTGEEVLVYFQKKSIKLNLFFELFRKCLMALFICFFTVDSDMDISSDICCMLK